MRLAGAIYSLLGKAASDIFDALVRLVAKKTMNRPNLVLPAGSVGAIDAVTVRPCPHCHQASGELTLFVILARY